MPKGSHCENGKTKKCVEAKVRRPAFLLGDYKSCGVQALVKDALKEVLFECNNMALLGFTFGVYLYP